MKHVKWKISKTVNLFVSKSRKKQPISVICPLFFLFHQCLYMLCAVAHKNFFHQYKQVTSYRIELFSLLLYFLRLFSLCDKFYKCNNISFHFICLCYVQLCFEKKRAKTKLLQPNQLNVEIQFRKCQAKNDKDNIPPSTDSHTNETKRIKQANNIYYRCCYCFYSFYFDLLAFRYVCSSACYLFNIFWYIFSVFVANSLRLFCVVSLLLFLFNGQKTGTRNKHIFIHLIFNMRGNNSTELLFSSASTNRWGTFRSYIIDSTRWMGNEKDEESECETIQIPSHNKLQLF